MIELFFKVKEFFIAVLLIGIIQYFLISSYTNNSVILQGATIEIFGLIFDILIFGILIGIYNKIYEKKQEVKRYKEELEDYRGWNEKEASYRIFGILKRLLHLKQYDIDLSNCYFENIQFTKNLFENFDFYSSKISATIFKNCNLMHSIFDKVEQDRIKDYYDYFSVTTDKTFFIDCILQSSSFSSNHYFQISFINCNLKLCDFTNSIFETCNFDNCEFENAKFDNLELRDCTRDGQKIDRLKE